MKSISVLVIGFSQSGQLNDICKRILSAFPDDTDVEYVSLKPKKPFPFPWTALSFFSAFPETFLMKPIELDEIKVQKEKYDLIILGYPVWFLSPAPPIVSFLKSEKARSILSNTPLVTITACRNMWINAYRKLKVLINENVPSVNHVANIALTDTSGNLTSVVTILRWMLSGKKDPFLIFPAAGIQEQELKNCPQLGSLIYGALLNSNFENLQQQIAFINGVHIKPNLVMLEKRGQKAFTIWSKFIGGADPQTVSRSIRVYMFMFLLPTVLTLLSPLVFLISKFTMIVKKEELERESEALKKV